MKTKGILVMFLFVLVISAGCLGREAAMEKTDVKEDGSMESKTADFKILSPAEGAAITGNSVTLMLEPINVAIKPAGGAIKAEEGHFHLTLDTGGYEPTAASSKTYSGLSPGQHTITIELMNNDHSSRSPKVLKTVTFTIATSTGGAPATTTAPATSAPYRY